MDYQATLDYLFTRLPMFSRIGAAAYKADLDNTIALCQEIGNPQLRFRSIHIAGTNGKGSVSHMLAAIFQQCGYRTGLYTSPHLKDFRERIQINGQLIAPEFVVEFTEKIKPVIDRIEPSFFEITVAMAFDYFARESVDIAIVEVGLGGRLDSTNIITPELSIITNIGWDHMNLLGDTLQKIAAEKAGIIKPGIPVVVGELLPETQPVFESVATERAAPIHFASLIRQATEWRWEKQEMLVEVAEEHHIDRQEYALDLPGLYQYKNLLTVLTSLTILRDRGWNLPEQMVRAALRQVKKLTGLHGRWETVHLHPQVILDVAHNEAGMRLVVEQLELTEHHSLHIIIGMVRDKEIDQVLSLLPRSAKYYFCQAKIPRAMPATELREKAGSFGLKGVVVPDVNDALRDVLAKANPRDMVLVCGSVFLVGEVNTDSLVS